jgi:tetratricopeptide (TPR) repeat protein/transcriptional regulator with XRE-family HTH domain
LNAPTRRLVAELRELKDALDLTLTELGTKTHYSTSSWERWLNGKRLITPAALASFAAVAGADSSRLLSLLERAAAPPPVGAETEPAPAPLSQSAPVPQAQPPSAPRPAQLPRDIPDYVGRGRELALLVSGLRRRDRSALPVWAVVGMGGLGKTALAVRAAHRAAAFYPGGTLYLDLQGGAAAPLTVDAALHRLLTSLGIGGTALPPDTDARTALLRSLLAGRRILIVLDNAGGAAQLRPLLPGAADCAVIITSRNQLAGLEGVHRIALDVLSDGEALELTTRLTGPDRVNAEPEAAKDVLAVCAGLPLALRIAGSRLAVRPGWSVRALAQKLRSAEHSLDELAVDDLAVRACFQASYDALIGEDIELGEARSLKLLGFWKGGEIGLGAAAALLDMEPGRAERELERLTDISLIQSVAPGRYRFHDLIRAFAAERALSELSAADQRGAVARLAAWYAHAAAAADARLPAAPRELDLAAVARPAHIASFAGAEEALDWYDAEAAALVTVTRQAEALQLDDLAALLPRTVERYWEFRLRFDEWIETACNGLRSAQRTRAAVSEAHLQTSLATAYGRAGLNAKAIGHGRDAVSIFERAGDHFNAARAMCRVAKALGQEGDLDEARLLFIRAIEVFESEGYLYGAGDTLNNLAQLCLEAGRAEEAAGYLLRGLAVARKLGSAGAIGAASSNLGHAYRELGRHDEALAALKTADEIFREMGHEIGVATNLVIMGGMFRKLGRAEEARDCYTDALPVLRDSRHPEADEVRRHLDDLAV